MLELLDLDYRPKLGGKIDYGIGVVGAGAIVRAAHLPAYRKAGFNVVGIYDKSRRRAEETAGQFNIPRVYDSLQGLLSDGSVEIVDIAVPARYQPEIARQAAAAKKHMLCQKPLAETYDEASTIVKVAKEAGVKLAVNQQMRWDQAIRASKTLCQKGWLGVPTAAMIEVNILTDWRAWDWLVEVEKLEIMYHSIHYLDSLRFLFGQPELVYASGAKHPGQTVRGETRTLIVLEYPGDLRAFIADNHNNWADDRYATFRLEGTEGVIKGTFGLLYNYPHGRPDTIEFTSKKYFPDLWFSARFEERWVPDAFIGAMGELMRAIEEDREPENSGEDNLKTLQLVHAAYKSMAEKRSVRPEEIR